MGIVPSASTRMGIFIRFPVKFPDTRGRIPNGPILIENWVGQRGRIAPSAAATISAAVVAKHPELLYLSRDLVIYCYNFFPVPRFISLGALSRISLNKRISLRNNEFNCPIIIRLI